MARYKQSCSGMQIVSIWETQTALACGGFLPPRRRVSAFPGGSWGRRAGAVSRPLCCRTCLSAQLCLGVGGGCRFSSYLVPLKVFSRRLLRASLARGCCFDLRRGKSSQARGGRRGCLWWLCLWSDGGPCCKTLAPFVLHYLQYHPARGYPHWMPCSHGQCQPGLSPSAEVGVQTGPPRYLAWAGSWQRLLQDGS